MSQSEFLGWVEFYKLYPFDDFHRIHRPAGINATQPGENFDARLDQVLQWLQPDTRRTDSDLATMRAFGVRR